LSIGPFLGPVAYLVTKDFINGVKEAWGTEQKSHVGFRGEAEAFFVN